MLRIHAAFSSIFCFVLCLLLPGQAVAEDAPSERTELARQLVAHLAAGKFAEAVNHFDATMAKVLPAEKLQEVWQGVVAQYGRFEVAGEIQLEAVEQGGRKYHIVLVRCKFAAAPLRVKVVFDEEQKIAGLFFVPGHDYQPPDYTDPEKFTEEQLTVATSARPLPSRNTRTWFWPSRSRRIDRSQQAVPRLGPGSGNAGDRRAPV